MAFGRPRPGDTVGVWGASPTARRGLALARRFHLPLLRVEDAPLRSVLPGRARGPLGRRGPVGLIFDPLGWHPDPAAPSLPEALIASGEAARHRDAAADLLARLRAADLSKYNAHLPDAPCPAPGFVLVIDQTRGDASLGGAGVATFRAMLAAARAEHPGRPLVLRTHPETARGLRAGHLGAGDLRPGEVLCDAPVSPWRLLDAAAAVYAVSSQMGMEAILAGHRPVLFGQPMHAGWGLSDDRAGAPARRGGRRDGAAGTGGGRATPPAEVAPLDLLAATHLLAATWYDPCRDRLTDAEGAVRQLEAEARAFRDDARGHVAYGMRLWKRRPVAAFFDGAGRGVRFAARPGPEVTLAWGETAHACPNAASVEDGFLRSRGLGAALVPPLSLIADPLGASYDPSRESAVERAIAAPLPPGGAARAEALVAALRAAGVSKYNLGGGGASFDAAGRRVILVPGQVEDDASIRLGCTGPERTNRALLARVRAENPDAFVLWKPHPDVVAGLRPGAVPDWRDLACASAEGADPAAVLAQVDAVWTLTSTLGFEALLRGVPVTTLGAPFYAGFGLTRDLAPVPARRRPVTLAQLVHGALISAPRYRDPVSGLPCPAEVAVDRLTAGPVAQGPGLRWLAKAQGALASQAWLWR